MTGSEARSRRPSKAYGIELEGRSSSRKRSASSSRSGKASQSESVGFLLYLIRRAKTAAATALDSIWVLSLPFVLMLMVSATDFLVLTNIEGASETAFFTELGSSATDVGREGAEAVKTQVQQYIYLFILILSAWHWREILGYFKQWSHLIVITACLIFTATYSIEPVKVVTNTVLVFFGFLVAILFAIAHASDKRYRAVYVAVFIPMFILNVASLIIFLQQGSGLIDFALSSQRYGGLAGNPNSLGASAVLGYWSALCLFLGRNMRFSVRVLAVFSIAIFILHVLMSGSGTSTAVIVLVTIAIFWLRILSAFNPLARKILNIGAATILGCVLFATALSSTPADLYLSFTESLGKDASMTGRTDLWDVARDAISVRPYLGWGYDSHTTVMAEVAYEIEFNHYHNGYLDTLVAGGSLLLILVLYNLLRFVRAFFVAFRDDRYVFPLVIPLIILLVLNLSEYSLLRPNAQIWTIYIVAFAMLTFHQKDKLLKQLSSRGRPNAPKQPRSRKRQLRWA